MRERRHVTVTGYGKQFIRENELQAEGGISQDPPAREQPAGRRYGLKLCGGGSAGSHVLLSCWATDYEDALPKLIETAETIQRQLDQWLDAATGRIAWQMGDGDEVQTWKEKS